MVNIYFLVTEPRSKKVLTFFKVLLESYIRMISCDSRYIKKQQILLYCGINLKVVFHRNRMKRMEKFAFKSPQRFHCKIKLN